MPIIEVLSARTPPDEFFSYLNLKASELLGIVSERVWISWDRGSSRILFRPGMLEEDGPIVFVHCKQSYADDQVISLIGLIRECLEQMCNFEPDSIYIAVHR